MSGISPNPACYRVLGRADEVARTMNSPHVRAEHLFLAIIRDDKSMPARLLARLVDLSAVEAAVMRAVGQAARQPPERPARPELAGFRVAAEMGDSCIFNWRVDDNRPWIMMTRPGNPRDALNAALVSLGRPPLT